MSITKVVFIFFTIISIFFLGAFFGFLHNQVVDFSVLENYTTAKPSILLDDEGVEWARFEVDKRDPIALYQVPQHVISAFLAAEDRYFYQHHGISVRGIVRSTVANIKHRKLVQGASTITQQLVKLLFFDGQKTFTRKIKEQFLALIVERQFTKDQILEIYLNHIYFGCGIYGISAACQRFFGKQVADIDYAEAAVLAGIQRCPALYCPLLNPQASCKRRNLVLSLMREQGYINQATLLVEQQKPLQLISQQKQSLAPYVKEYLRVFLEELFGKQALYTTGLKIQTTINRKLQTLAEQKFQQQFSLLKKQLAENINGALVSLDVKTGEVKALIGGVNFATSQFNRALQAKRQIGSVVKPFVYAAAVEHGFSFAHTELDEPVEIKAGSTPWMPNNYNNKFEGQMTLAKALSASNNIVTIKMLLKVGAEATVRLLKKAGLQGEIPPYPSLALGCVDASLLDTAAAFNVFSNNGTYVQPHMITWIKNALGQKIWIYKPHEHQVLDPIITGQVTKVLNIGINRYLKRTNSTLNTEVMGKTGTTNDWRTCWFAGSSPELTTALYIGKDDNSSLGNDIYPVRTVFPIWLNLYKEYPCHKSTFSYHTTLKPVVIDWNTGIPSLYGKKSDQSIEIVVQK